MKRGSFGNQVSREGHRQQECNSRAARGARSAADQRRFDEQSQFMAHLPPGRIERRVRPTPLVRLVHPAEAKAPGQKSAGGVIVTPEPGWLMRFLRTPVGDLFRRRKP